jgi:hypothetical protein
LFVVLVAVGFRESSSTTATAVSADNSSSSKFPLLHYHYHYHHHHHRHRMLLLLLSRRLLTCLHLQECLFPSVFFLFLCCCWNPMLLWVLRILMSCC